MQFIDDAAGLKAQLDQERLKPVNTDLMLMDEDEEDAPAQD